VRARTEFALLTVMLAAAFFYGVGLFTGAVTAVGYESGTKAQSGFSTTSNSGVSVGIPVWLGAGSAIRADYAVEARFGSVMLSVAPPVFLRTSLQTATAYVEGSRAGSLLFVAEAPGWYTFDTDPSPQGGPRCGTRSLKRIIVGDASCPTYDVSYSVTWRLADPQDLASGTGLARLSVPGPHGKLAVLRIR
jgi:hypothetical protein